MIPRIPFPLHFPLSLTTAAALPLEYFIHSPLSSRAFSSQYLSPALLTSSVLFPKNIFRTNPHSNSIVLQRLGKMQISNSRTDDYAQNLPVVSTDGRPLITGVVFDMDGTLTVPCIDFLEMRRRVGVPCDRKDILHEIESWDLQKRTKAYEIIGEMEEEASKKLEIMPGAFEICSFLDSIGIRRGLITRNVRTSVEAFHLRLGLPPFSPALSREFRPYKPSPSPLLHICQKEWSVHPANVVMVGDSPKDDIVCGKRAGAFTCLLVENSSKYANLNVFEDLPEEERPHFAISSILELEIILRENFTLVPSRV